MQVSKANRVQVKANAAKFAAEEKAARASNDAKLAAAPKRAPEPKVLAKGSGALVGVAQGAMDGQPHTKLAVAEARKRMAAEARGETDAVLAKLAKEEAATPLKVMGTEFASLKAAKAKRASVRASLEFAAKQPRPDPTAPKAAKPAKPAKAKPAPKAAADRAYTVPKTATAVDAKPGSWRLHMLTMIVSHKSTAAAKAAHVASGKFAGQALDFNWSAKQGYITFS